MVFMLYLAIQSHWYPIELRFWWVGLTASNDDLIIWSQRRPDFHFGVTSVFTMPSPIFHKPRISSLWGSHFLYVPWWIVVAFWLAITAAILRVLRPAKRISAAFPVGEHRP